MTHFDHLQTTDAVLMELGQRVQRERLRVNLTQEECARESGCSRSTVDRLERGHSIQLSSFMAILKTLALTTRLEMLLPEHLPSPMQQLERKKERKRASGERPKEPKVPFIWGEEQ